MWPPGEERGHQEPPPGLAPPRARSPAHDITVYCQGRCCGQLSHGVSINLVSLYLEGSNCSSGSYAAALAPMSALLNSCKLPSIAAGDLNASPEMFWKSAWCQKLGVIDRHHPRLSHMLQG
eukprot:7386632-Pyramimonas_sp.AAC.1